jgi:hypothetical protein
MLETLRRQEDSPMAIALDDALAGWLLETAGEGLVRWLREDPARAAMRKLVEEAVGAAVAEVAGGLDDGEAAHLRDALLVRNVTVDGDRVCVTDEAELRDALLAWTAALDEPQFEVPGYLSGLGVDPGLLAEALFRRIITGIERDGRRGGALNPLAEWLWRDRTTAQLERLEDKVDHGLDAEIRTGGLPGGTGEFTGRDIELVELAQRIEAHDPAGSVVGIHVVHGMPGVGKTALALRVAHEHKNRYPDGQFFLDLHGHTPGMTPVSPEAALSELLHQAGVPDRAIPAGEAARQARWRARAASRRALVVLDNALDVAQVQPLLPMSAGCLTLVTSRDQLSGLPGGLPLALDVLPVEEAVALFRRLVGANRCPEDQQVAQLVELIGCLPLAIEMVAGRMRNDPTLTVADLVTDLSTTKGRVDETSPQQAGVRAAFTVSVLRLDRTLQSVFRMLGIYPGPVVGVPQFAALADVPPVEATRGLRALAERSLIRPTADRVGHRRYVVHDLVRDFAREQAASLEPAEEHPRALARLVAWYAAVLKMIKDRWEDTHTRTASTPDPSGLALGTVDEVGRWLAAERLNLLMLAYRSPSGSQAADLCMAAGHALQRNQDLFENVTAARELFLRAADMFDELHDPGRRAVAANHAGDIDVHMTRWADTWVEIDRDFDDFLEIPGAREWIEVWEEGRAAGSS